jgi:hypothetical protein
MRALGQPYTRSRHYHLYLNGHYWGLYQTEERPDANFGASYFGGNPGDYDVIRPETGTEIGATDGDLEAWRRLWQGATVAGGLASDAAYYRLQGRDADGTRNPAHEVLLDVENLIDYMLAIFYIGSLDGPIDRAGGGLRINNFYVIRDRTGERGFRFLMRDAEFSLLNPRDDVTRPVPLGAEFATFNPMYLHQALTANARYRAKFAARAREVLGPGGVFAPGAARRRFLARAREIESAVLGESARWGDAKRPRAPLTPRDWEAAVNRVVRGYFPVRTGIVIGQLRARGLYPRGRAG